MDRFNTKHEARAYLQCNIAADMLYRNINIISSWSGSNVDINQV